MKGRSKLQRSFIYTSLVAGVSINALALTGGAWAQDNDADSSSYMLEEIVVTAQFRKQNLQDTPISITAMDANLMESRNQTDLSQIVGQAPNVSLNAMGGAYGSSLGASIRGVGQYDFNPAYEPGVGMYIDDVYYATLTGGIFDLLDLDRVEVLRGPQGTLTGRNSIGGAIKLFTQRPGDEDSGSLHVYYGSRNRTDVRGSANFVLGEGLYGRVSGVYKHQDGYVDQIDYGCANPGNAEGIPRRNSTDENCVVDKLGEKGYAGVRAQIRYNPSEDFDLMLTGEYTYEERTNSAEVLTHAVPSMSQYICGDFCTYANFFAEAGGDTGAYATNNFTTFESWGMNANMTIGLSDNMNLQSITAYREYVNKWGTDDDFTPDLVKVGQGVNDLSFWFFSQELRLNGSVGDNIEYTIGAFYSDQRSVYYTQQDIRYIAPGFNLQFLGNDPINADSKAVFGTVIFHPTEAMTLTGGLRYTEESKDYTFSRLDYNGNVHWFLGALDGFTAEYSGNKVDWRLSADYRVSDEVLVYATAATGFKGGGVTARPFNVTQARDGSFDPETVTAYEVGLKTDLMDRRVRLNLSAFYNDYKDIQLPLADCSAFGGGPCGVRANAGNGTMKGVEAELLATPTDGLTIDGSVSYLTTKWSEVSAAVGSAIDINDPIATPKWKWAFGAQYEVDMGSNGSLTPRFDVSNIGKQAAGRTIGNVFDYYSSYTLVNANIKWENEDRDLSIAFEVQNLFDKYYIPFSFRAVYAFTGTAYSQVGRPREWAISVKKKF